MMFEEAFQAKVDDPGSFVIPLTVGESEVLKGMLDLGASINMMPFALYEKLCLVGLEPTRKKLMLVDRTSQAPHGEIKDVPILVDGIVVSIDFMVLDIEEKSNDVARWQVLIGWKHMGSTMEQPKVEEETFEEETPEDERRGPAEELEEVVIREENPPRTMKIGSALASEHKVS
ncbi:hypothetical protein LWI29_021148 [Acer saccharum]|uniref:Uncharacterized protein n=1 Tax=Acer saccharum TaxID=4024 RepID=A0AA39RW41_ACESA|nr:hypothetical protein LWI29_021148 [Acer saccharum]